MNVTNLSVQPNGFSPDGDGANDTTTFAFVLSDTANVSIQVQAEGQNPVVLDQNQRGAGAQQFVWSPSAGQYPDGLYTVAVIADGTRYVLGSVTVDTVSPVIGQVEVSRGMFSPNADGVNDTTEISFTVTGTDPTPLPVGVRGDNIVGTVAYDGTKLDWISGPDGIPRGAKLMVTPATPFASDITITVHGVYRNVAVSNNLNFTNGSSASLVTTDLYDGVTGFSDSGGMEIGDQLFISWFTGSAAINVYSNLGVFVANLPISPTYFGDGEYFVQWGPELNPFDFPDGDYTYRITVADDTGNSTQQSGHLILNNTPIAIEDLSVSAERISPEQQDSVADQSIFSFELSKAGKVTVTIYDKTGNLVRTLVPNVTKDAGVHSVLWDGTDDSGLLVDIEPSSTTTYTYYITVFDPLTNDTDQATGSITVDNEAPGAPTVPVLVSPRNETIATISGVAEADSQVEIRVNGTLVDSGPAHEVTGEFSVSDVELSEGSNLITVRAIDSVGNTGDDSEFAQEVLVDLDIPSTSVLITSTWQNTDVTVTFEPEDESSDIAATYYTTDGTTPSLVSSVLIPPDPPEVLLSDEGIYTIRYFSVDLAGNIESVKTASEQIRIDTTAPDSGILELRAGETAVVAADFQAVNQFDQTPIFLRGQAVDPAIDAETDGAGVQKVEIVITPAVGDPQRVRVDGITEWSYAFTPDTLDMVYTIESYATDAAGNAQSISTPVSVELRASSGITQLVITPVAGGAIHLEWSDIGGSYDVYRSTNPNLKSGDVIVAEKIATTSVTTTIDTNTQDGTQYYYWITTAGTDTFGAQEPVSGFAVADKSAPQVENIAAVPSPFTPDGDRIDDETTIYFTLTEDTWVTLRVYYLDPITQEPQFVRSLIEYNLLDAGDQLVTWDGFYQSDTGNLSEPVQLLLETDIPVELRGTEVPPGTYLFRFEKAGTYDRVGNSLLQEVTGVVEVQESVLSLGEISVLPNPFSPDGDRVNDVTYINYTITSDADYVAANIFDTTGGQQKLIQSISIDAKRYVFSTDAGQWVPVHVDDGIPPGRSTEHYYLEPVDPKDSSTPPFDAFSVPDDAQTVQDYIINYQAENPNWVPVSFSLPWDGRGATQQGAYIFLLTATNRAGQKPYPKTGEIVLESLSVVPNDKTAPVVITTEPGENADVRNQISEVSAVLNDGQGTGVDLSNSTIRLVGSNGMISGEQSNNGLDTIKWILSEPLDAFGDDDGLYSIVISTADLAGNYSQTSIIEQFQYNMRANDVLNPKADAARVRVKDNTTGDITEIALDKDTTVLLDHVGQPTWSIDEFIVDVSDETEGSGISLTDSQLTISDPNGLQLTGGKWPVPLTRTSGSLLYRLSASLETGGLHDGVYVVTIVPVDLAGNHGNTVSFEFNYRTVADQTAPQIEDIVMDLESGKITVSVLDPFPSSGIDFDSSTITVAGPASGLGTLSHSGTRQTDGSVAATLEYTLSETLLVEGRYTVEVSIADTEGYSTDQSAEFVFDLTPPEIASSTPAEGTSLDALPPDISVVLRDRFSSLDTVQTSLLLISTGGEFLSGDHTFEPGTDPTEGTFRLTVTEQPTEEGIYQIWILPVDEAGNRGDPITIPFRLDATAPELLSMVPEADGVVSGTVDQIDVTLSDLGSGLALEQTTIQLTDPNGDPVVGSLPTVVSQITGTGDTLSSSGPVEGVLRLSLTVPLSINGLYSLSVNAVDMAGNSALLERPFTYDNVAPRLAQIEALDSEGAFLSTITEGGLTQGAIRQIQASVTDPDPGSGLDTTQTQVVLYDVDGQIVPGVLLNTADDSTWRLAQDLDTPGVYTVGVTLVDQAGNTEESSIDFSFSIGPGGSSQLSAITTSAGDGIVSGSIIRSVITGLKASLTDTSGTGIDFDESQILLTKGSNTVAGVQTDNGVDALVFTLDAPLPQDGSADGNYTIHVTVADNSGNLAQPFEVHFIYDTQAPTVRDVILDTAPPLLFSETAGEMLFSQDIASLSVVLSDVHAGVDTTVSALALIAPDGTSIETTQSDNGINLLELSFAGLPMDGTYALQILPADRAGNQPKTAQIVSFRYDTTPPTVTSMVPDFDAVVTSATAQVQVTLDDSNGSGVDIAASQLSVSGPGTSTSDTVQRSGNQLVWRFASPLSSDGTDDGTYTVSVLAADLLGNRAAEPVEYEFTYSVNAPLLVGVTPSDGSAFSEPIRQISAVLQDRGTSGINFEFSDIELELIEPAADPDDLVPLDGATLHHNGINTLILTLPRLLSNDGLDDGVYEVRITAVSNAMAGQTEFPVYTTQFLYDSQSPVLSLITPDDGTALGDGLTQVQARLLDLGIGLDFANTTLRLTGPEGMVSGRLTHNGIDTITLSFAELAQDGDYTITVDATDLLENVTSVTSQFVIDTTPPTVAAVEPASQTTVDRLTSVSATLDDGIGVGIDLTASNLVLLDASGQAVPGVLSDDGNATLTLALSDPPATDGTEDGSYSIQVTATDLRGNTGVPVVSTFNYSTTSPSVLLVTPSDDEALNTSLSTVLVMLTSGKDGLDLEASAIQVIDPAGSIVAGALSVNAANQQLSFQLNKPLATDGSEDGEYTVAISVVDEDQQSTVYQTHFRLDTTAPDVDDFLVETSAGTVSTSELIGTEFTGVSVALVDSGVGVDLEASTLTLQGPDGEIAGVASHNGRDRIFWRFLPVADDGAYTISILPVDILGNTFAEPLTTTFVVDRNAPVVIASEPVAGTQVALQLTEVQATLQDDLTDVDLAASSIQLIGPEGIVAGTQSSDGSTIVWTLAAPLANNGSDDGAYTIQVIAADSLGNVSDAYTIPFEYVTFVPELVGFEPQDGTAIRTPISHVSAELQDRSGNGLDFGRMSIDVAGPGVTASDTQAVLDETHLGWLFSTPLATDGSDDGVYTIALLPDTTNPEIAYTGSFLYDTTAPEVSNGEWLVSDGSVALSSDPLSPAIHHRPLVGVSIQLSDVGIGIDLEASSVRLGGPLAPIVGDQTNNGLDTLYYRFPMLSQDGSADGLYTLTVDPIDQLGNRSAAAAHFTFLYDTQAPTVVGTIPAANATIVAPIDEVSVTLSDASGSGVDVAQSTLEVLHNGLPVLGSVSTPAEDTLVFQFASPLAVDGSSDGTYTLRITPTDQAGNQAVLPVEVDFLFTTTSPRLVTVVPGADTTINTGLSVVQTVLQDQSGTGIDLNASQVTLIGPEGPVPGEAENDGLNTFLWRLITPLRQDGTDDGAYTISVIAADNTGLQVPYTLGFQLDTLPPVVESFAPEAGEFVRDELTSVSASLNDAGSDVALGKSVLTLRGPRGNVAGTQTTPGGNTLRLELEEALQVDGTDDGIYTISVVPVDEVGNEAPRATTVDFHYDTRPPVVTSTFPEAGNTVTVAISSVSVALTDQNGTGVDLASSTIALRGPQGLVPGTQLTSSDNSLTLLFVPFALDGSDNGDYTIEVSSRDVAGNESHSLEVATFLYQPTAPELVETLPARGAAVAQAVQQVRATFRDHSDAGLDMGRSSIRLEGPDGEEIPGTASQYSDNTLAYDLSHRLATDGTDDGVYHILTSIYDRRGNRGDYSVSFTYDTTEPTVSSLSVMAAEVTTTPEARFTFSDQLSSVSALLSDGGVGLDLDASELSLLGPQGVIPALQKNNGIDTVLLTFQPLAQDGSADGIYTIAVRPIDQLDNHPASASEVSFLYDTQPPVVLASEPEEGGIVSGQRQLRLNVLLDDQQGIGVDASGSQMEVFSPTGTLLPGVLSAQAQPEDGMTLTFAGEVPTNNAGQPLQSGEYTIVVRTKDLAGNISDAIEIHFVLDAAAPVLAETIPELSSTVRGDVGEIQLRFEDDRSGLSPDLPIVQLLGPSEQIIIGKTEALDSDRVVFRLAVPLSINGWYTLNAGVSDAAGNRVTHSRNFLYDNTPPQVSALTAFPTNMLVTEGRLIQGTVYSIQVATTDPEPSSGVNTDSSRVVLRSAQGAIVPGTLVVGPGRLEWQLDQELSDAGVYTAEVMLLDRAGNQVEQQVSFGYSSAPVLEPEIAEVHPAPNAQLRTSLEQIVVRLNDKSGTGIDLPNCQLGISGPGVVAGADQFLVQEPDTLIWRFSSPLATDGTDDGEYTILVNGVDDAGNAKAFAPMSFLYDTRPPEPVNVVPAASKAINAALAEVTVALEDAGTGIDLEASRIRLIGPEGAVQAEQTHNGLNVLKLAFTPLPTDGSADGVYVIEIDPVDLLQNRPVKPFASEFLFDTRPPVARLLDSFASTLVTGPTSGIRVVLEDVGSGVDLAASTIGVMGPGVSSQDVIERSQEDVSILTWRFAAPFEIDGSDDGQYTVLVTPVDLVGNQPAEPILLEFSYSATAPVLLSIDPADGAMLREPFGQITAELQDRSGQGIDWSRTQITVIPESGTGPLAGTQDLTGSTLIWTPATPFATDGSSDALYQIEVQVVDKVGGIAVYRSQFEYDTLPPSIALVQAGSFNLTQFSQLRTPISDVSAKVTDSGVGIDLRASSIRLSGPTGIVPGRQVDNGKDLIQWTFDLLAIDGSNDGAYTVEVDAVDLLGNLMPVPTSAALTFDTQAPYLESSQPTAGDFVSTLKEVTLVLKDEHSSVDTYRTTARIVGPKGTLATPSSAQQIDPHTVRLLLDIPGLKDDGSDDGTYTVNINPVDQLGNMSTSSIQFSFNLSTTTPTISEFAAIDSTGLSERLDQIVVTLEEKGGRGLDLVNSELAVDGPGVSDLDVVRLREPNQLIWQFAFPLATDGSDDGIYSVHLLAVDGQGSSAPYTVQLSHDTQPPAIRSIQVGADTYGPTVQRPAVTGTLKEITVRLTDQGVGIDLNASSLQLTGPAGVVTADISHNGVDALILRFATLDEDGIYVLGVNPVDLRGNQASAPLEWSFYRDTQPPVIAETNFVTVSAGVESEQLVETASYPDVQVTQPFRRVHVRIEDAGIGVDFNASSIRLVGPSGIVPGTPWATEDSLSWMLNQPLRVDGSADGLYSIQLVPVDLFGLQPGAPIELIFEYSTKTPELVSWSPTGATRGSLKQIAAVVRDRSGQGLNPATLQMEVTGPGASVQDVIETADDGLDTLTILWVFDQPLATDGSDDGVYLTTLSIADNVGAQVAFPTHSLLYDTQPPSILTTIPARDAVLNAESLRQTPFEIAATLADDGVGIDVGNTRIQLVGPQGAIQGLKSDDGAATVRFRINTMPTDGTYQILVKPVDMLGNASATDLATSFVVDTQAPVVASWLADSITLESGQLLTEPVSAIEVALDDAVSQVDPEASVLVLEGPTGVVPGVLETPSTGRLVWRLTQPLANDGSEDGDYRISATVTDVAGNAAAYDLGFSYTTTSPQIVSTQPARGSSINGLLSTVSAVLQDNSGTGLDLEASRLAMTGPQGLVPGTLSITGQDALTLQLDSPPARDGSADGEYILQITAADNTGVQASYEVLFLYDNQPPSVVLYQPAADAMVARSLSEVSVVLDDALSGLDLLGSRLELTGPLGKVPGNQTDDGEQTLKWLFEALPEDGSADGWYTLQVFPVDHVGNQPPQAFSTQFIVDTQPPQVRSSFPQDESTIVNVLDTISVTLSDEVSGVDATNTRLALIGPKGAVQGTQSHTQPNTLSLTFSPLPLDGSANGEYRIEVIPQDRAGNHSANQVVATFTYQPTAPRLVESSPTSGDQLNQALAQVSVTLADRSGAGMDLQASQLVLIGPHGAVEGAISDNELDSLTLVMTRALATDGTDDGDYELQCLAVDRRGNRGSYRIPFHYDTTAPVVRALQVAAEELQAGDVVNQAFDEVAVSLDDALVGVDLNASLLELQGPSGTIEGLQKNDGKNTIKLGFSLAQEDGDYEIRVLPKDTLGNTLAEPQKYAFVLDSTPPQVASTEPADQAVVTGLRLFKIEVQFDDANGSGIDTAETQVELVHPQGETVEGTLAYDGQTLTYLLGEPLAVTGEDDGVYELTISAVDIAGNRAESVTTQFTYDTEQPLAPKLEDVAVQPLAFSPNQDGILDTTEIRYRTLAANDVTIEVFDENSASTSSTSSLRAWVFEAQPAGTHQVVWNGQNDGGVALPDGIYRVRIAVVDPATGRTTRRTMNVGIDTQPPVVSVPTLSSNPFTPDGDGFADTVTLQFSVSSATPEDRVLVRLIDPSGLDLTPPDLTPAFSGDGNYQVVWNGEGATADGNYRYVVQVQDLAGNAREHSGLITLDREAPEVTILLGPGDEPGSTGSQGTGLGESALPRRTTSITPVIISGTISDTMGVRSLEVLASNEWQEITIDDSGHWAFSFDPADDGIYELKFRATDTLGHIGTASLIEVNYDTQPPQHLQTQLVTLQTEIVLSRIANGELFRIESLWDGDAYNISVDMSDLDSTAQANVAMLPDGLGKYTAQYQLANNNRHPDGQRELRFTATDSAGNTSPVQVVQILLDNTPPQISRIAQISVAGEPAPLTPVNNGSVLILRLEADQPGYEVYADFAALDSAYLLGTENVSDEGAGVYTIRYLIAPDNSMADGRYEVPVTIWDSSQSISSRVTVELDNTPPEILSVQVLDAEQQIVSGQKAPTFKNGQTITVLMSLDAEPHQLAVDFGAIDSAYQIGMETVTDLGNQRYQVTYAISEANQLPDLSGLSLPIEISDRAQNHAFAEVIVRLDNTAPVFLDVQSTDQDALYRNGDTVNILVTLDEPGYEITADFSLVDSTYRDGSEKIRDQGDGTYLIQYTLNASNTLATGRTLDGLTVSVSASDGSNLVADERFELSLDNHPPALSLVHPVEGDRWYASQIQVAGTTESTAQIAVRVGDAVSPVPVEESTGSFETTISLLVGVNRILVTATDPAGNTSELTRTVKYLPRVLAKTGGTVILPETVDDGIPDNETRIIIPRDTLEQDGLVQIEHVSNFQGSEGLVPVAIYRFTLMDLAESPLEDVLFRKPVRIVLQYADRATDGSSLDDAQLGIFRWDGVRWRHVGGEVDERLSTISASVDRLSVYGVFVMAPELTGGPHAVVQPLITPNGDGVNDAVTFPPDSQKIRIFDLRGRPVREITDTWSWDGRDDMGQTVLPGLYLYHVQLNGQSKTGTIVVAQ